MAEIRIIAVTLAGKSPLMVMASVTDTACHLLSIEQLPSNATAINQKLVEVKQRALDVNADLLIEDPTGLFTQYGRSLHLGNKDHTGRPILVNAMTKYTALERINAITYPDGAKSRFTIPPSVYNIKQQDNGTVSYEIQWEILRDESRAMLLCVYSGLCQTVYQDGYLSRLFDCFYGDRTIENKGLVLQPDPDDKNGHGGRTAIL